MKPYYRKATVEDALYVANNLRPEDLAECMGLGHTPLALPFVVVSSDVAVVFCDVDGTIGGIAGISPDKTPDVGIIWMLCTPHLTRKPHTFVRQARKWLKEQSEYRLIWNVADARNKFHHKLLKLLGFSALRTVYPPPHYLPYLEIVKLCA